jgi:hypothetical protein
MTPVIGETAKVEAGTKAIATQVPATSSITTGPGSPEEKWRTAAGALIRHKMVAVIAAIMKDHVKKFGGTHKIITIATPPAAMLAQVPGPGRKSPIPMTVAQETAIR